MLNPSVDRLDYGEKLQAPEGFQLSYAVATSYSLELDTLLCLPLALSLNGTLEGNPHGGKLAALEGIRQLKGRLKVFFQQGNIKVPSTFTPLFTLLEPCLVPMVPSGGFSSFHPKIWLLRFTNDTRQVRYRLLVLSRNLTFDRSWDLAVALEGRWPRKAVGRMKVCWSFCRSSHLSLGIKTKRWISPRPSLYSRKNCLVSFGKNPMVFES